MGRARSMHEGEEDFIQGLSRKVRRQETERPTCGREYNIVACHLKISIFESEWDVRY
jgi:hypothetical protein